MRVCRVGAGGELCQMLFGNLEVFWLVSAENVLNVCGSPLIIIAISSASLISSPAVFNAAAACSARRI